MIVAIDGGVATGKSAVGRRVAEALGLPFVDTGLMYRAVALAALERRIDVADGAALTALAHGLKVTTEGRRVWLDGEEVTDRVYEPRISEVVSRVAKIAGVRLAMVAQQRAVARGGVVMAGRDIGTVVFPDADHKFFLTASVDERVRRRAAQLAARGEVADTDAMATEVTARDRMDSQRTVAPLRAAEDALVVDTDAFDLEGVVAEVLRRVRG
ncbi:MAG: (d)CMP kinase [Chloroflexi bacterium]|nr:MAG: (d)CMP kinase [Chloroflexota bacterium]